MGLMEITDGEFEAIRKLVYSHSGINLTGQKKSLVVGRLQKIVRGLGFVTFQQYLDHLNQDASRRAIGDLINRISTNHTFFFREKDHFDFMVDTALPGIVDRLSAQNSLDLRVWCAGCSTGEEAYGLIMQLMEYFGPKYANWDAGLLATDISQDALRTAMEGVYPEDRVATIPPALRYKYFQKRPDGRWRVDPKVRSEITFRRFNLMNKQYPFKKPFHIIFCRNVMIYFDQSTREQLVRRFYDCTAEGGYLFIGHSESLRRDSCPYRYVQPAVYQKRSR